MMWRVYIVSVVSPSIRIFGTKKDVREEAERWMDFYPLDPNVLKYEVIYDGPDEEKNQLPADHF